MTPDVTADDVQAQLRCGRSTAYAHLRHAALLQRAVEGPARPRRRVQRLVRRVQRRRSGQPGQSPSPTDKTDGTDE